MAKATKTAKTLSDTHIYGTVCELFRHAARKPTLQQRKSMRRPLIGSVMSTAMVVALTVPGTSSAYATAEQGAPISFSAGNNDVDEDGEVHRAPDGTITFTFRGEAPEVPEGDVSALACPEVRNPAVYTVTATPFHIKANPPKSTWLEPNQSVKWITTSEYTFALDVTVGAETEAGAVIAKAKVKIDVKISNTWKSGTGWEVYDQNNTKKAYRAVLGNMGYKTKYTKSWVAAPCNPKKSGGEIIMPKQGDLSIGRYPN